MGWSVRMCHRVYFEARISGRICMKFLGECCQICAFLRARSEVVTACSTRVADPLRETNGGPWRLRVGCLNNARLVSGGAATEPPWIFLILWMRRESQGVGELWGL